MPEESVRGTTYWYKAADFVQGLDWWCVEQGATAKILKREVTLSTQQSFDHVQLDKCLAWEEPFGPVLPFNLRVSSVEEQIKISNESGIWLQGAVHTRLPMHLQLLNNLKLVQFTSTTNTTCTDNFHSLVLKDLVPELTGNTYRMTRAEITSIWYRKLLRV